MRVSGRSATLWCASLTLVVLAFVALVLPVPYVTLTPGPTVNTLGDVDGKPVIDVEGVRTYPTDGTLSLTTVSVTRQDARISLAQAFAAYLDEDDAVVPRDQYYPPDVSAEENRQESADQMTGSKETSEAAALRAAGYTVPALVYAGEVVADGPAAGKVQDDDRIVAIDGERVGSAGELVRRIRAGEPGETLTLGIVRDGERSNVRITTDTLPAAPGVPRVGIMVREEFDFPVRVVNNLSEIGGPSAGTMFALAIYDKLESGDLTGGRRVAGTGEITADGQVLPIGGIQQKIAGAADAKASIFLVPADNCAAAVRGHDFGLELVRIETLEQAIDALEKLADDPDADVPRCER